MFARYQGLVAVIVLLAMLFFAIMYHVFAQPLGGALYDGIPLDAKLLALDKLALDEAYSQQLVKLWIIWLADGGHDSSRIKVGLRNARRAYAETIAEMAKREQEMGGKP